jgi:ectoine hydroxylase-related dioxygenase (phytanoyl-CoA dioxygenase family)
MRRRCRSLGTSQRGLARITRWWWAGWPPGARGGSRWRALPESGTQAPGADAGIVTFTEEMQTGPWIVRLVRPGKGTASHCDIVFMGRGTTNLYTSWTPLGDIDRRLGGLMVLEGSHRLEDLQTTYGRTDVDTYCENRFDGAWTAPDGSRNRPADATGALTEDHVGLRRTLGGRWLTADFTAGDLLVFGMYLVHASLDNQTTDRLRLSSDSRYQLASEPADERWIGPEPPSHGPQSGRGVIC